MDKQLALKVEEAKQAAIEVLRYNASGPFHGLPRTAGWGYPEPYTRDQMIASLGVLVSDDPELINALRRTLEALAETQTPLGHISSLAHDPIDVGASDTTPLFLMGLALFRKVTGEADFLNSASEKALNWMAYQSPGEQVIVSQLPTSDWRDEQWVLGYGLFVNTVVYSYLRLYNRTDYAAKLLKMMNRFLPPVDSSEHQTLDGKDSSSRPYYPLWAYKIYSSDRFDLLGNSLAIISGIAPPDRAKSIICWVEDECDAMRDRGELAVDLPPNLFPFILPTDSDWIPRYADFNMPGDYHNGGIWPFICGFYVVAVLAAGHVELAERKLEALTELVRPSQDPTLAFGFNEWIHAQDGTPKGNDWQTWSASMYLYAATCVERKQVIFFDELLAYPLQLL